VAKTTKVGKLPIKFECAGEYSVIPALIKKPLFD